MKKARSRPGQRGNTSSATGKKSRSTTSTSHGSSRLEPSHITLQKRVARQKNASRDKTHAAKAKRSS